MMMEKDEIKNWQYAVLIGMLCIIITLLCIVIYKVVNSDKKNVKEDTLVSTSNINEKLYKTFSRKNYDALKNIKDDYVVKDMKLVQSNNSYSIIKLNDKEVNIRYAIYQEENKDKEENKYYSYYLELYFNNNKLNRVMKILDTKESYSELGSIKLDNIYFNKIDGLDNREYLIIDSNIYLLGKHYVYVLNDEFKIVYEVPFITGQDLYLSEDYDLNFDNKLNISNDSIYYLSSNKKKIDIHRVTFYNDKYYDEVVDTKNGSISKVKKSEN